MTGIITDNIGRSSGLMKTAAAGGKWTLISTTNPSNVSDLTIGGMDSSYRNFMYTFDNVVAATDDGSAQLRAYWIVGGSATSGNVHEYGNLNMTSINAVGSPRSGDQFNASSTAGTYFAIGGDAQGGADSNGEQICGMIEFFNPSETSLRKIATIRTFYIKNEGHIGSSHGGMTYQTAVAGGGAGSTAAVTGIKFYFSAGNITSGQFKLWGCA